MASRRLKGKNHSMSGRPHQNPRISPRMKGSSQNCVSAWIQSEPSQTPNPASKGFSQSFSSRFSTQMGPSQSAKTSQNYENDPWISRGRSQNPKSASISKGLSQSLQQQNHVSKKKSWHTPVVDLSSTEEVGQHDEKVGQNNFRSTGPDGKILSVPTPVTGQTFVRTVGTVVIKEEIDEEEQMSRTEDQVTQRENDDRQTILMSENTRDVPSKITTQSVNAPNATVVPPVITMPSAISHFTDPQLLMYPISYPIHPLSKLPNITSSVSQCPPLVRPDHNIGNSVADIHNLSVGLVKCVDNDTVSSSLKSPLDLSGVMTGMKRKLPCDEPLNLSVRNEAFINGQNLSGSVSQQKAKKQRKGLEDVVQSLQSTELMPASVVSNEITNISNPELMPHGSSQPSVELNQLGVIDVDASNQSNVALNLQAGYQPGGRSLLAPPIEDLVRPITDLTRSIKQLAQSVKDTNNDPLLQTSKPVRDMSVAVKELVQCLAPSNALKTSQEMNRSPYPLECDDGRNLLADASAALEEAVHSGAVDDKAKPGQKISQNATFTSVLSNIDSMSSCLVSRPLPESSETDFVDSASKPTTRALRCKVVSRRSGSKNASKASKMFSEKLTSALGAENSGSETFSSAAPSTVFSNISGSKAQKSKNISKVSSSKQVSRARKSTFKMPESDLLGPSVSSDKVKQVEGNTHNPGIPQKIAMTKKLRRKSRKEKATKNTVTEAQLCKDVQILQDGAQEAQNNLSQHRTVSASGGNIPSSQHRTVSASGGNIPSSVVEQSAEISEQENGHGMLNEGSIQVKRKRGRPKQVKSHKKKNVSQVALQNEGKIVLKITCRSHKKQKYRLNGNHISSIHKNDRSSSRRGGHGKSNDRNAGHNDGNSVNNDGNTSDNNVNSDENNVVNHRDNVDNDGNNVENEGDNYNNNGNIKGSGEDNGNKDGMKSDNDGNDENSEDLNGNHIINDGNNAISNDRNNAVISVDAHSDDENEDIIADTDEDDDDHSNDKHMQCTTHSQYQRDAAKQCTTSSQYHAATVCNKIIAEATDNKQCKVLTSNKAPRKKKGKKHKHRVSLKGNSQQQQAEENLQDENPDTRKEGSDNSGGKENSKHRNSNDSNTKCKKENATKLENNNQDLEKRFYCCVCPKRWPSGGTLRKHLKYHKGFEKAVFCRVCSEYFDTEEECASHQAGP